METGRGLAMRYGWALWALSCLLLWSRISALSVTVQKEECIYEYVFYAGDAVSGNFLLLDYDHHWKSDHASIDFTVTSPGGNTVHSLKGSTGDKFDFKASESGLYKFCFHNHDSIPESVSFNIHTGHIPNKDDLAKDEHLDPIHVRLAELKEKMEYVTLEQNFLKMRDVTHRRTNQSTKERVMFYTVGEYILLMLVSGLQVMYIRRLFGKSVAYGRV